MKSKAELERDTYYKYLHELYNTTDDEDLIPLLTEEENQLREELELKAMKQEDWKW